MKTRLLTTAIGLLGLSIAISGTAQAGMIAGWDFSQYFTDNELSIDGATYTTSLKANYSNLDPTSGAGAESGFFGTFYYDGSFGSSSVAVGTASAAIAPISPSLVSNVNVPVTGAGLVPFDTYTVLQSEGQAYANDLSLLSRSAVKFVFAAYLNTVPQLGSNWSVSFGGQTDSGTSTIGIEYSTDGTNYVSFGSKTLTSVDSQFSVALGTLATDFAFVRFSVDPTGINTRIDNVAINGSLVTVPEPTTLVLLGTALAVTGLLGRRRTA